MKSKLIVIEGTDGSGKNTQKKLLVDKLNDMGINSTGFSFPRYGTPLGDIIGDIYLGKTNRIPNGRWFGSPEGVDPKIASVLYSLDRFAHKNALFRTMSGGINIICDRYVESNMGHQGGKIENKKERKKLFDFVEKLEYELFCMPKANLTIFLHMPFTTSLNLIDKRGESKDGHENPNHLKNAEKCYLELKKRYDWPTIKCSHKNGNPRDINDIHDDIFSLVSYKFNIPLDS